MKKINVVLELKLIIQNYFSTNKLRSIGLHRNLSKSLLLVGKQKESEDM